MQRCRLLGIRRAHRTETPRKDDGRPDQNGRSTAIHGARADPSLPDNQTSSLTPAARLPPVIHHRRRSSFNRIQQATRPRNSRDQNPSKLARGCPPVIGRIKPAIEKKPDHRIDSGSSDDRKIPTDPRTLIIRRIGGRRSYPPDRVSSIDLVPKNFKNSRSTRLATPIGISQAAFRPASWRDFQKNRLARDRATGVH